LYNPGDNIITLKSAVYISYS